MKANFLSGIAAAGVLTLGAAAFGQSSASQPSGQQPSTSTSSASQSSSSASGQQPVTVTGCIEREADFRKAHEEGRGGVAGTGVGTGNEFVLISATSAASGAAGTATPTGTSGSASMAYELTGPNEGQVGSYVGRRVEITGKLKPAETTATGQPTGGATAGAPPRGVDVASKDLQLRELEVTSVRESTGSCPASK
jgi:hypothetical protein